MDYQITDQDALFFQVFQPYSKKLETIFLKGCKNTVEKSELSEEKRETLLETIKDDLESAENVESKDLLLIYKEFDPIFTEKRELSATINKFTTTLKKTLIENKKTNKVFVRFKENKDFFWDFCLSYIGKYLKNLENQGDSLKRIKKSKDFLKSYEIIKEFLKKAKKMENPKEKIRGSIDFSEKTNKLRNKVYNLLEEKPENSLRKDQTPEEILGIFQEDLQFIIEKMEKMDKQKIIEKLQKELDFQMQKIEDLEKKSSNNLKELTDKSKARKDKKKNLKNDLKKSQEDLENYKKELSTLKKKLQDSLLESQRNIEKIKLSEKNLEERTISLKKHMKLIDFLKDQNLESMEKHKRDNENLMDQVNKGFLEKDEEIRDLKRDKDKFRASNNTSQDVIRGLERENQNFKDDKLKMDNLFREKDKELHLKNQEYEKLLMKKKKYEDLEDKISEKDKEIERLMRKVKKLKDDDSSSEEKPAKEKKKSKQK